MDYSAAFPRIRRVLFDVDDDMRVPTAGEFDLTVAFGKAAGTFSYPSLPSLLPSEPSRVVAFSVCPSAYLKRPKAIWPPRATRRPKTFRGVGTYPQEKKPRT